MKRILNVLFLLITCLSVKAIDVTLTPKDETAKGGNLEKAAQNLAKVLTEINSAQKAHRYVETGKLPMDDFSSKSLARMWATTPFYCDDEEVVEECWIFKDGSMMVNHIPLIITPEEETFGMGTYQEAVVEFDKTGRITDFRLSVSAQMGEDINKCDGLSVTDIEKRQLILKTIETLRTAYCQRDIETIEKMYSDDALIITGKVMVKKDAEFNVTSKKVEYTKQSKSQYITKLKRVFKYNKWLDVKFSPLEELQGCSGITQSKIDPTKYGVRLLQEWNSQNYSDVGYLFLLWEFPTDGRDPIIHVRTWQESVVDGEMVEPDDDISTLGAFSL